MKFTLSWLREHLETDATLDEIARRLTMIGLEVEAVDDRAVFRPFTIARVVSAAPHPDADRLKVLKVDGGPQVNGGELLDVVCGAPNAREGLVGVLALPGTYVPGIDMTLGVGRIRGVASNGMMCSERELLLSDEHDGIIDLPADAPVGETYADYAGLADPVIEIGLTPNRPDATGVAGIARDLAASGLGRVKTPAPERIAGEGACPVSVTVETSVCRGFALRAITGVANGPSPRWLQARLRAIGLRPINALVDVTNYITFDRGRPLHVFDAAKVRGGLIVRGAGVGETILGLDGQEHTLAEGMGAIADENGVESIAGIMGGEASGCDGTTTEVLVESALWDPLSVARTGRDLGISTDARYRFERGVDPAFMEPGLDLATRMILDLCGGTPSERTVAGKVDHPARVVEFPFSEVERLTGRAVAPDEQIRLLEALGFKVERADDAARVTAPSWRPDVEGKADLVEEIMRLLGVDGIEPQPLPAAGAVNQAILTVPQRRERAARRTLAARGMREAVTYTFIAPAQAAAFGGGGADLVVENPIAADMAVMRPSLLPSLIAAAARNAARGFADVALFEVGATYADDTPKGQARVAGGVRRGTAGPTGAGRHWDGAAGPVTVYDAKADALAALAAAGAPVERAMIEPVARDWYHPGRSGAIKLGPKVTLAEFGELHPAILKTMDANGPHAAFEVFLDAIPEPRKKATKTRPALRLSPFQPVRRDFAFIVDEKTAALAIVRAAQGADKALVGEVRVFDVFAGAALGEGRKSVGIEVTLEPRERTLTDEDLEAVSERIVQQVHKATGATLRQ